MAPRSFGNSSAGVKLVKLTLERGLNSLPKLTPIIQRYDLVLP